MTRIKIRADTDCIYMVSAVMLDVFTVLNGWHYVQENFDTH